MNRMKFFLSAFSVLPLATFPAIAGKISTRSKMGFKVTAGESRNGKQYRMKGVTLNLLDNKISSDDTNGAISVFEQTGFTPDGGPPLHIHMHQDEFFYILEGEYLFRVGDDEYLMKTGDTIFLPRNVAHAFKQLTKSGRVIVSYLPAGQMEAFFQVTDSWTSPPTTGEMEKAFADHGMKVVGPAL